MSRDWFTTELETVATWWRVFRKDGIALGFTSHDRDLRFDDILHRTAPGMVPSAIRLSADFEPDSAEVAGALDHAAITPEDLAAGRYDGARVEMVVVDWETLDNRLIYAGTIGEVSNEAGSFSAELRSVKSILGNEPVPRTSPTCRAEFCGPGCNLSPARYRHECALAAIDQTDNAVTLSAGPQASDLLDGTIRIADGVAAGLFYRIAAIDGERLILEPLIEDTIQPGDRLIVREGCDHRWETCHGRFGNALNFRGEPFLPGNDLLTRYPASQ